MEWLITGGALLLIVWLALITLLLHRTKHDSIKTILSYMKDDEN
ncbi:hypothetical protein [Enterobacter ludwigii]